MAKVIDFISWYFVDKTEDRQVAACSDFQYKYKYKDSLTQSPHPRVLLRNAGCPAGGNPAAMQRGRPEEERDHHPLPGNAERHPGPDRGAQQPQHQAVPGEQRPG